jgi:hypothetical protein
MNRPAFFPFAARRRLLLWAASLAICLGGCRQTKSPPKITPEGLRVDRNQDGTVTVTFTGWKGSTDDYRLVKDYPTAKVVRMANPDVTDEVLPLLQGLDQLRELDLSNTRVTNKGLTSLRGLDKLEILQLANTRVTDKCFKALAGLKRLRRLDLLGTKVTRKAAKKWLEAKPGRHVQQ